MKLIRLLPCVAAATLLLPAGIAQAQPADPQVVVVTPVVSCGKVVVSFDNPDVGAYVWGWATGPFDVAGEVGATGTFQVPKGKSSRTVELPEDSFGGRGFVTLSVVAGPNTPKQPFRDLGLVDTDCAPPVVTPTTTPSSTPSATASATPSATPSATASSAPESSTSASSTPVVIDDADFDQVGEVPVGSVDTGRA